MDDSWNSVFRITIIFKNGFNKIKFREHKSTVD